MKKELNLSCWSTDEDENELRLRVRDCVLRLPPRQAILVLTFMDECRQTDGDELPTLTAVGQKLGRAKATIHEQWSSAIAKLIPMFAADPVVSAWLRRKYGDSVFRRDEATVEQTD